MATAQSWGIPLYIAELAFDDAPFQLPGAFLQIRGDSKRHAMWQKERLLNLLEKRLPPEVDAVAWIDADLLFLNPDWPQQALAALQHYPVIQPWTSGHSTTPDGKINKHFRSVGAGGNHPGWAWAARREMFPLYDLHVAGSGDTMMSWAWTKRERPRFKPDGFSLMNPEWRATYALYEQAAWHEVQGRVGCIPGEIIHLYHGEAKDRHYFDRWRNLINHRYDPLRDLAIDPDNGLWQWATDKPQMHQAMRDYPLLRKEDG